MTREEAIKIINCYDIGFYDLSGAKIPADKLADAFDMAIEALSADSPEVECYVNGQMVVRGVPDGYLRDDIEGVIVYSDSFYKCFKVVRSKRKGGDDE